MTIEVFRMQPDGAGLRIGIVQARFNEPLCDALREACVGELMRAGVDENDLLVCSVPGALEIPIALQGMARSGHFDALIALGAVVRGETYHFEVVSNESAAGVSRVSLDFDVPIANGILTVDTDEQARARVDEKGADAARAALEMAGLIGTLASLAADEDDESEVDDDEEEE